MEGTCDTIQLIDQVRRCSGKWTKLAELLNEMGFSYKKQDNRRYYYEQPRAEAHIPM